MSTRHHDMLQHVAALLVGLMALTPKPAQSLLGQHRTGNTDWTHVGGDPGQLRYSPLRQINRTTVKMLEVAWTYHTGELAGGAGRAIACTPIVVDDVMYVTTGHLKVVALNASTGEELWQFNPFAISRPAVPLAGDGWNRGVAYWSDGRLRGKRRIVHATADGRLFSLDAQSGRPDRTFGAAGVVDMRERLDPAFSDLAYGATSAPAIYRNLIIVGLSNGQGPGPVAPGDVRAFDIGSGKEQWRFGAVPRIGEVGNNTWQAGSWQLRGIASAAGGLAVDERRGQVFAAMGSATFDFYGGDRKGHNLFSNTVVALDARTGTRRWHFQTLHHDIWGRDLPAAPNLVTVTHDGRQVDAVAQVTQTGFVFLFDRVSGKALFEVKEHPVAASSVPGEQPSLTQPIPVKPSPLARQFFTEQDISNISVRAHDEVLARFRTLRAGPPFNPPSLEGTVVMPGLLGGANWSGASIDPTSSVMYVNSNNVPSIVRLTKAPQGSGHPYKHSGHVPFTDKDGYPAIRPPWGNLTAIDLRQGEFLWRVPLGEYPELTARGLPLTGTENIGGTIVTAGGLVFVGATKDERFHAFDKFNGTLLWEHELPAGGYATPCTYMAGNRQYVVIAAGGAGRIGTKAGDAFVAFALPQ